MPLWGKYIGLGRRPVTTTADCFHGAEGVTINGGVHTVADGHKMTFGADANMNDVQRAGETALPDGSILRKASLLPGAKNVVVDGATMESIAGVAVTVTGKQRSPCKQISFANATGS